MSDMQLAQALRQSSPQQALLIACRQLREWIDLPEPECLRRIRSALTNERVACSLVQAKSVVWGRLAREFAAPDSDVIAALGALDARTASGTATAADSEYVRRVMTMLAIHAFVVERVPSAAAATAHNPQLEQIVALVPALEAALHGCDVHVATATSIAALQSAIELFTRRADSWTPPIHVNHAWWLGMAQYTAGRAALETGNVTLAREAFEKGALEYERAGEWDEADDLRNRILAIDRGTRGDIDAVIAEATGAMLLPQDLMRRCASLAALATACKQAGDQFEYARVAQLLANELHAAGFDDPEHDAGGAMRRWVAAASERSPTDDLLKSVGKIAGCWSVVMGARATDRNADGTLCDAARAARAEMCLPAIGAAIEVLLEEAASVNADLRAELAEWYGPHAAVSDPVGEGAATSSSAGVAGAEMSAANAKGNTATGAEISSALYALRLQCNEHATDEQLAEVKRLAVHARAIGSHIHEVQALLEQAYILLALERYADVPLATNDALRALAPTGIATLDAFTLAHERDLYLSAKAFTARALVGLRNHHALLQLCQDVVDEIERQRVRVTAPYQQSAFLSSRAEFYEYGVAAAYKLGRHDLMLDMTERLKASSAWKLGRASVDSVSAEDAARLASLDAQYRAVNRTLAMSHAQGTVAAELLERRRRIATARAIARSKTYAGAPPALTVADLKRALREDEAALSWFWLSDDLVLLLACTHDRFETFPIELAADDRRQFNRWLALVAGAAGDGNTSILPEIDGLVDALAPTLFPASVRHFVTGSSRLILCPHRTLHLFPFHATRVPDDSDRPWLIQHVSIRYAPNLTSLLLEGHGNHDGDVLAIGIDDFGTTGFPSLAHAVEEAGQVALAHGATGHVVTASTREAFTSMPLSTYRCLHLATHGTSVLTGNALNDPLDCGIAFADGMLDGWQLAALDLRAELIVLASCYSGQRAIGGRGLAKLPGDDILGLQAVLFDAGAGTILGALWSVDDESSRAILVEFHRHYSLGTDPDLALQAALITYLGNPFRHHGRYHWAPFFLTSVRNPRSATRPL